MQNMSPGKSALGLDANVVAGLCYVPVCYINLILSIIVLVTDKTNKLARFHAFQSIFVMLLWIVVIVLYLVGFTVGLLLDNAIGYPIFTVLCWLIIVVLGLALLIGLVIAAIKAFQGQIFKLPIVGNLADKYSG